MSPRSRPSATSRSSQVRIIGGQWRSRMISFGGEPGLRPTGNRIRETLFNWLQQELAGARVLDLFAGSGALGFEAASRGAERVWMIEYNRHSAARLRENCRLLGADQIQLEETAALQWIAEQKLDRPVDIIFIDPPFEARLHQRVVDALTGSSLLTDNTLIYIEYPVRDPGFVTPAEWSRLKSRSSGEVGYALFQVGGVKSG